MPQTSYEYKEMLIRQINKELDEVEKDISDTEDVIKEIKEKSSGNHPDTQIEKLQQEIYDFEEEITEIQKRLDKVENTSGEELLRSRYSFH